MTSYPPDSNRSLSADDALPPVEPPSAGFLVQLFVVPGVIVTIIVLVWLMFNWLANKGQDVQAYVEQLQRPSEARWQAAVNLANALREDNSPANRTLKNDAALARQLAAILERELESSSGPSAEAGEQSLTLRIFLCRALGEFSVPDGAGALVKAARPRADDPEGQVRRTALEALALLADNVRRVRKEPLAHPQLAEVLLAAAIDNDPQVRSAAAYALGSIDVPKVDATLAQLAGDSYADVAYNAATSLARRGNPQAVDRLVEMLDPQETAGMQLEKVEELQQYKRTVIIVNALRAVRLLAEKNGTADLSRLQPALQKLRKADVPGVDKGEVEALEKLLAARAEPAADTSAGKP